VYDRAKVGLRLEKIKYESQKVVELTIQGSLYRRGLPRSDRSLAGGKTVVELKAVGGELGASEEQQIRNHMKILKIERGLLINFQQPSKNPRKTKLEIELLFPLTLQVLAVTFARPRVVCN
jgi:GxxExxY protein